MQHHKVSVYIIQIKHQTVFNVFSSLLMSGLFCSYLTTKVVLGKFNTSKSAFNAAVILRRTLFLCVEDASREIAMCENAKALV